MPRKSKFAKAKLKVRKSIMVMVTDDSLSDIDKLADNLAHEGMEVQRIMPGTGVITGSADPDSMSHLKKIKGVLSVEEEVIAHPSNGHLNEG